MLKNRDLRILALLALVAAVAGVVAYLLLPGSAPEPVLTAPLPSTLSPTPTSSPALSTTIAAPVSDTMAIEAQQGLDLGNGLRLTIVKTEFRDPDPFVYQFALPRLEGSPPDQIEPFNREVDARVAYEINSFQAAIPEGEELEGGGFGINYTVPFAAHRLLSVQLEIGVHVLGSAQPSAWTSTINYDLAAGRVLALADLFRPGTDYLDVLSRYCLDDLERQGVLYWDDGAQPVAENYETKWNFSPWGLLITFDEYTIAPYEAGSQSAIVPYEVLQDIAAPDGPLTPLLP